MSRPPANPYLTATDVATLLGVKPNTVTAWKARNQMPRPDRQYGRTPLWRQSTITRWQATRRPPRPESAPDGTGTPDAG